MIGKYRNLLKKTNQYSRKGRLFGFRDLTKYLPKSKLINTQLYIFNWIY